MDDVPSTQKVAVKSRKYVMSNKTCWKQPFSEANSAHMLDTKNNLRENGTCLFYILMRDFQTLGLQRNVKATVRIIFISLIKITFSINFPVFN